MEYNLLICTASNYWVAIDVNEEGECDRISFDGNGEVKIGSVEDVSYFCSQVMNYYNIESFTDISLDVKIVVVGEYSDLVITLFENVKKSSTVSIIDVKNIIPIYVLKKCMAKQSSMIDIECMDELFTISIDDDYVVSYGKNSVGKSILLNPEDLSLLYRFDCCNLISDEQERKELEDKYNEAIKKQEEYSKLKEAYDELKNKYKKLEEDMILKNGLDDCEKTLNSKRIVLWFTKFDVKNVNHISQYGISIDEVVAVHFPVPNHNTLKKYKCRLLKKDGDVVPEKAYLLEIIECNVIEGNKVVEIEKRGIIKATATGRVFYLVKDGEMLDGDAAVAIISDQSDTKEKVMEWYKKME